MCAAKGVIMIKIAVCDDDDGDLRRLKDCTSAAADKMDLTFRMDVFPSGEALLGRIRGGAIYHLVILDILMDTMDGIETAKGVRELLPEACIGFMTSSRDFAVEAFEADAIHYLIKPVDVKKVGELLERYRVRSSMQPRTMDLETDRGRLTFPIQTVTRIESYNKGVLLHFRNGADKTMQLHQSFTGYPSVSSYCPWADCEYGLYRPYGCHHLLFY